jgi:protein-S-isoprenylcysteine O-methyltransferase Ste14
MGQTSIAPVHLVRQIERVWRATPRGAIAFVIVLAVLATAEPTLTSLAIGGAACLMGELLRIATAGYGYQIGELSLRGPYRLVRHPHFLGTALLYFGLCIAGRSPYVMAFAIVAMTFLFRADVRRDEARLQRHLGPKFADYRAQVPAFVPQLYPVPAATEDKRGFSLEIAVLRGRHRELDALLGLVAAFGLLALARLVPAKDMFHLGVVVTGSLYLLGRGLYFGFMKPDRSSRARRSPSV